jgi:Ser/Thr protein kinase RdoA (MazF antagonist)
MAEPDAWRSWAGLVGDAHPEPVNSASLWRIDSAADGGTYLLKRRIQLGAGDQRLRLAGEYRILTYLAAAGLPVAVPMVTDDAKLYAVDNGVIYTLTPELPAGPSKDDDALLLEIGASVARLHGALADCPYGIESWEIRPAERAFDEAWPRLQTGLPRDLWEILAQAITPLRSDLIAELNGLPVQRIHGDCHAGNILSVDGRVSGFIDLDHLPTGPRAYDLAYYLASGLNWLIGQQAEPSEEQTRITKTFLQGYWSVSELSSAEVSAITPAMIAVQLILAEWHLRADSMQQVQQALKTVLWLADRYDSGRADTSTSH